MECGIPLVENVYWVGVNDRRTALFEAIWPIPRGVSYNSYLIRDEKVVLIDAVKDLSVGKYLQKLRHLTGPDRRIDYLVINHLEPDHSGAVPILKQIFPQMQVVGNKKTAEFLESLYGIRDIHVVQDGDELKLGKRTLQFHLTPMVHWPETMMTYEASAGILFSGDAFGGFGTLDGGIFDDEVDIHYFEDEILRYFSNIVGKYAPMVQKAIKKLGALEIKIVASTHGPIWRSDPGRIIGLYDRWSRYEAEPGVVLAFASMYGNTEKMVEAVARGLAEGGEYVGRGVADCGRALQPFSQGGSVRIVLQGYRQARGLLKYAAEGDVQPSGEVGGEAHDPLFHIDQTRTSHPHAVRNAPASGQEFPDCLHQPADGCFPSPLSRGRGLDL